MIRSNVLAAKARLAKGYEDLKARHHAGGSGVEICALMSNLRDAVIIDLVEAALAELGEGGPHGLLSQIALVAHGGYGRRDVAPASDVDLMILCRPGLQARVAPLAERLLRNVFDVGLVLGHSVRTPGEACRLGSRDPMICSSLADSRLLSGSSTLFENFMHRFQQRLRWGAGRLMRAIRASRNEEGVRYGETVFLLEPNIKRSPGTLRDLQLLRWIGLVRYGLREPRQLAQRGLLVRKDLNVLDDAYEFLLRLRNDLHFHAGQANDVLNRSEQLRLAELRGYQPGAGVLPVERFMQDYFRHTNQASHVVAQFVVRAASHERWGKLATVLLGHRVEDDLRVGPVGLTATRRGLSRLRGSLAGILRVVDLANLHDVPIAPSTWQTIRHEAAGLPAGGAPSGSPEPTPEASGHFLSLLSHPGRIAAFLRDLHEVGILERLIPDFARARGLLQFNQYHKYTVDEHCIRAVEFAERLAGDPGPVGRVYRGIADKHVLHLALLLHDLGKGFLEDHREIGRTIAQETGQRLGLPAQEIDALTFLVHKHLRMNHLAFRRDTSDEELVVRFAVQVGSPELLQMLYVLTAADLGAVGPDVWDGWKSEVITDLYHRTMQQLAGDSPATTVDFLFGQRRAQIRAVLGPLAEDPWFARHLDALPAGYLSATPPPQVAADLGLLHALPPGGVTARAQYLPETASVQFTVGTSEEVAPGIFHRLTGALSSHGLEIRSAQIHTLADGLVLDRFWVHDPDFAGEPSQERLTAINGALERSLREPASGPPVFRRTWLTGGRRMVVAPRPQTNVNTDNSTSDRYTIIDVFATDRTGLLYTIARTLFEEGLSVSRAKIGTYLDQVVDVFYVTDQEHRKVQDQARLEAVRRRLLEVIETLEPEG
ncbi:MAG: [protein-PII] uridylyltransferase [Thermoguttaceae bacterium]